MIEDLWLANMLNKEMVLDQARGWREAVPQWDGDSEMAVEYTLFLFHEWLLGHLRQVSAELAKEMPR